MKHYLLKTWLTMLCLVLGVGGAWANTYTKVSSLSAGKSYLVVYYNSSSKTYYVFDGSNPSNGAASASISFSPANDVVTGDFHSYTVEISNSHTQSKYLVKTASGSYIGRSADSNGVDLTTTKPTSGTNYDNTIAYNANGYFTVVGSGGRALGSNSGSWKYYSSANAYTHLYFYEEASSNPSYTLSFANNTNGTFSAKVDGNTVASGSKVEAGKTVTLTAEPRDGYVFNAWNVYKTANQYNYVTVSGNNTFTMPSEAVTVDAYFIEGKNIPNAEVSLAAGTYRGEQSVTITNLDENEYSYYYTLDGSTPEIDGGMNPVGTTQEYKGAISITESCTLSILTTDLEDSKVNTFAYVIEYPYTVTIEEPENGSLSVLYGETPVQSGDQFYKGETITATATPAAGYKVRYVQFTDATTHTFKSNVKEWNMGAHDITISAAFDPIQYFTVSFSVNGTTLQSDVYEENATITAPAVSDLNGKKFMGWVKSTVVVDPATAPTYETIAKATENVTYVAVFADASGSGEATTVTLKTSDNFEKASSGYAQGTMKDDGDNNWNYYALIGNASGTLYVQLNSNANGYNVESPDFDSSITTISIKPYNTSTKETRYFYLCSSNSTAQPTSGDIATIAVPASEKNSIDVDLKNADSFSKFYIYSSAALGIQEITLTYGNAATYSNFTTTPYGTGTFRIGTRGFGTYCTDHAYVMPEGVQGGIYTMNGGDVELSWSYQAGATVPANEAVLLKGAAGEHEYIIDNDDDNDPVEENLLKGCTEETPAWELTEYGFEDNANDDYYFYKLSSSADGTGYGWYWGAAEGASFTCAANKCVLVLEKSVASSPQRALILIGDETLTSIDAIEATSNNAAIFDLQGRRVRNTQNGVYVVNGKKVIR